MGIRTSVYLSDELAAMWRASGLPLGELVRRGLAAGGPVDEVTLRRVVREVIRDELAALPVAAPQAQASYGGDGWESERYFESP